MSRTVSPLENYFLKHSQTLDCELFFVVVVVDVVLLGFYLLYMTREILSFLKAQCVKFSGKIGIYRGLHDS